MYKIILFLFLNSFIYGTNVWNAKVYTFGNFEEVLKYQGSGDSINLKQLKKTPYLYGIGLTEFFQNEILILDGKAFISSVKNEKIKIDNSFKHQASFLVYTKVPQWISYKIPSNIYTKKQFEEFLEELAQEEGIDTYEPFAFMLEGNVKASRYRVFSHNPNDTIITNRGTCASCKEEEKKEGSKKRYLSSTLYSTIQEKKVTILGFYSNQKGVITTNNSYTNMNFLAKDQRISGHMLNMMIGKDMVVKLPKSQ